MYIYSFSCSAYIGFHAVQVFKVVLGLHLYSQQASNLNTWTRTAAFYSKQAQAVRQSTCDVCVFPSHHPSSGNTAAFFFFAALVSKSRGAMGSLCSSHKHRHTKKKFTHTHIYMHTRNTHNTLTQERTCYQKLVPLAGCQKKRAEANTNPL